MTQEQQLLYLEEIFSKIKDIQISKGQDYATTDRLSNIKATSSQLQTSQEKVCLFPIATKISRLVNLMDNKDKPNHESIEDNIIDLISWTCLLYQTYQENNKYIKNHIKINMI